MRLIIAVQANTLQSKSENFAFARRWEAAYLALLHHPTNAACGLTVETLNSVLAKHGQSSPLNRMQMKRLIDSSEAGVASLLGEGAFALRFSHVPRQRTVGPWRWMAQPGDVVEIVAPVGFGTESGLDALLNVDATNVASAQRVQLLAENTPRLMHSFLVALADADKFAMAGDHSLAADGYAALLQERNLTAEGRVLLLIRQARCLKRAGEMAATREVLHQALVVADFGGADSGLDVPRKHPHPNPLPPAGEGAKPLRAMSRRRARSTPTQPFGDPGARFMAEYLLTRVGYDEAPARNFRAVASALGQCVPQAAAMPYGTAEWHNTMGLTQRRVAQAAWAARATHGAADESARAQLAGEAKAAEALAWDHLCSSVYWALSSRDFDNVQNFLVNMGMHCAAVHDIGLRAGIEDAFAFYELSLAYAGDFACGEDTAWEHVVLGNLWLDFPHLRERFADRPTLTGLAAKSGRPGNERFFAAAVDVARRKGDARQHALALQCAFRFGEQVAKLDVQRNAVAELTALFKGKKSLREALGVPGNVVVDRMLAWGAKAKR